MGARYSFSRTGTALSTTNDYFTLTAPATRALKIWEIRVAGGGTASAAAELIVQRAGTVGVTGGGGITPSPLAAGSAAAAATVFTTWTTQPGGTLTILRRIPFNANGAINTHIYVPGMEIDVAPSAQISFRSGLGTSLASVEVVYEEVG